MAAFWAEMGVAYLERDYEGQKGKSINVNCWWNMGDTSTKSRYFINDWYLGQIFSLYTCNYGFIYLQILV
jgi:hypothetical protein